MPDRLDTIITQGEGPLHFPERRYASLDILLASTDIAGRPLPCIERC